MIEIIPAVLPKSWRELEDGLEQLRGVSPLLQIDVVSDIFAGHENLPHWDEFDFEFDLFVEPASFVERALELGASRVVVHERFASAHSTLELLQSYRHGDFATLVGLGLRATDSPDLESYAGLFDFVQVMGIAQEGAQGHPPALEAITLVRALRAKHPALVIQVDGAVGPRAREFRQAGANRLVVGSAILNAEDPKRAYKELYTLVNAE